MSNVSLTIGGRTYTVACAPGEESHIQALGRTIDGKLAEMDNLAGQSESRTLLFAALLLADELHERGSGADARPLPDHSRTADQLELIAGRLESLADRLESPPAAA